MLHSRLLLGALGAAALATAGCGSSDDATTTAKPAAAKPAATQAATTPAPATSDPGKRPTKSAYLKQADAKCKVAKAIGDKANQAVQQGLAKQSGAAAADAIDKYGPQYRDVIAELQAMPRPKNSEPVVRLFKLMNRQILALASESAALRQGDNSAVQEVGTTITETTLAANDVAKQYGFKVCGRVPVSNESQANQAKG